MALSASDHSGETQQLLRRAAEGDPAALGSLLDRHRKRLRRMIVLRLDLRLQGRLDASDVIQEAFLEAATRLPEYLRQPSMPFFLWLRFLTGQKLMELHRHHLGAQMRDARREVSLYRGSLPATSSAALAAQLLGHDTRPSEAAIRAERKIRLQEALNSIDPRERRLQLVQALQDRAHADRMSRRQGQRYASLDALSQAAQLARELKLPSERFAQLRNEAIACMAMGGNRIQVFDLKTDQKLGEELLHPARVNSFVWNPDGRSL